MVHLTSINTHCYHFGVFFPVLIHMQLHHPAYTFEVTNTNQNKPDLVWGSVVLQREILLHTLPHILPVMERCLTQRGKGPDPMLCATFSHPNFQSLCLIESL